VPDRNADPPEPARPDGERDDGEPRREDGADRQGADAPPPPYDDGWLPEPDDRLERPDRPQPPAPVARRRIPGRVFTRGTSSTLATPEPDPTPTEPELPLLAVAADGRPPTDPESALQWMNERHAVVLEGGRTRVLVETHDEGLDRRLIVRCSVADFGHFYANRRVFIPGDDGKERREGLAPWWFTHPRRRTYEGVTFAPNQETPRLFNLWRGFGVARAPGDWSRMRAHIAEIICANVAETFRWLLAWMAEAVRVLCQDDSSPMTQKIVQDHVRRAARRANVRPGVHILRHTFCSHLAMRGAPARAIQAAAGHKDLSTTQRYMHVSPAAVEDAIRLLDGAVGLRRGDNWETKETQGRMP
jgi:hypothetical protein